MTVEQTHVTLANVAYIPPITGAIRLVACVESVIEASQEGLQGLETVSSSTNALQAVALLDEFLNVTAIKTVPLFEHLSFDFCGTTTCSPPRSRVEHEFTSHETTFVASCTTITRMTTAHFQLPENFKTALSGTTAVSINRHREIQLSGFSPILRILSMMYSLNSSSRPR